MNGYLESEENEDSIQDEDEQVEPESQQSET